MFIGSAFESPGGPGDPGGPGGPVRPSDPGTPGGPAIPGSPVEPCKENNHDNENLQYVINFYLQNYQDIPLDQEILAILFVLGLPFLLVFLRGQGYRLFPVDLEGPQFLLVLLHPVDQEDPRIIFRLS